MTQQPSFPAGWVLDQRGDGRAVRVSAHVEAGFLVLSTWKADVCVATVRLLPDEGARLIASLADGLARLAASSGRPDKNDLEAPVSRLEAHLGVTGGE